MARREGIAASTKTFLNLRQVATIRANESIVEYVTEWTRKHFGCSRDEALERLKRGHRQDGMPPSLLQHAFVDYATVDIPNLRANMIADLGEETAGGYLNEIHRVKNVAIAELEAQQQHQPDETLDLPDDVKTKYLLTVAAVRGQWTGYLEAMRLLRRKGLSGIELNDATELLYFATQVQEMSNVFSILRQRGLLR